MLFLLFIKSFSFMVTIQKHMNMLTVIFIILYNNNQYVKKFDYLLSLYNRIVPFNYILLYHEKLVD
jgi:hypothetical protein